MVSSSPVQCNTSASLCAIPCPPHPPIQTLIPSQMHNPSRTSLNLARNRHRRSYMIIPRAVLFTPPKYLSINIPHRIPAAAKLLNAAYIKQVPMVSEARRVKVLEVVTHSTPAIGACDLFCWRGLRAVVYECEERVVCSFQDIVKFEVGEGEGWEDFAFSVVGLVRCVFLFGRVVDMIGVLARIVLDVLWELYFLCLVLKLLASTQCRFGGSLTRSGKARLRHFPRRYGDCLTWFQRGWNFFKLFCAFLALRWPVSSAVPLGCTLLSI